MNKLTLILAAALALLATTANAQTRRYDALRAASTSGIELQNNAGTAGVTVDNSAVVNIPVGLLAGATGTPSASLEVNESGQEAISIFQRTDSGAGQIQIQTATQTWSIRSDDSTELQIRDVSAGTTPFTIDEGTPDYALELKTGVVQFFNGNSGMGSDGSGYFGADVSIGPNGYGGIPLVVESGSNVENDALRITRAGTSSQYIDIGTYATGTIDFVGTSKDFIIKNSATTSGDTELWAGGAEVASADYGGNFTVNGDLDIASTIDTPTALYFEIAGTQEAFLNGVAWRPITDSGLQSGHASFRWSNVYAKDYTLDEGGSITNQDDSGTHIDFSSGEILNLVAGGSYGITIDGSGGGDITINATNALSPGTDGGVSLGDASTQWASVSVDAGGEYYLWNQSNYFIDMGNGANYVAGPISSGYTIKVNQDGSSSRGFSSGAYNAPPTFITDANTGNTAAAGYMRAEGFYIGEDGSDFTDTLWTNENGFGGIRSGWADVPDTATWTTLLAIDLGDLGAGSVWEVVISGRALFGFNDDSGGGGDAMTQEIEFWGTCDLGTFDVFSTAEGTERIDTGNYNFRVEDTGDQVLFQAYAAVAGNDGIGSVTVFYNISNNSSF